MWPKTTRNAKTIDDVCVAFPLCFSIASTSHMVLRFWCESARAVFVIFNSFQRDSRSIAKTHFNGLHIFMKSLDPTRVWVSSKVVCGVFCFGDGLPTHLSFCNPNPG